MSEPVRVLSVTDPTTGESFDVDLGDGLAHDLAAFCEVTGERVERVLEAALRRFLNAERDRDAESGR